MIEYKIGVCVFPMSTPKPSSLVVVADGKPVADLTIEQVRAAVLEYDAMLAKFNQHMGIKS